MNHVDVVTKLWKQVEQLLYFEQKKAFLVMEHEGVQDKSFCFSLIDFIADKLREYYQLTFSVQYETLKLLQTLIKKHPPVGQLKDKMLLACKQMLSNPTIDYKLVAFLVEVGDTFE